MNTYTQPDKTGHFGAYGGRFVPETLMAAITELEEVYEQSKNDPEFQRQLSYYLKQYIGRKPLLFCGELNETGWRCRHLSEARRLESYWSPQNK